MAGLCPLRLVSVQLREHSQQIEELQAAWEGAKKEEEQRGGGAADSKRWVGVRTADEARDLLRTVFRVACDQKWVQLATYSFGRVMVAAGLSWDWQCLVVSASRS